MTQMSPAQRAAKHAEKIREREARKWQTPGPGSYENPISATNSRGNNKRPSSAFSSRSKRLDPDEKHVGDPGSYNPYASRELAQTARSSFNNLSRNGSGGFGGKSARLIQMDLDIDTPGPGAYVAMPQAGLFNKMPSSSFRSSSAQRSKGASVTPGVGSYRPNHKAIEPSRHSGGAAMRGQGSRFLKDEPTTDDALGPGAYHCDMSMASDLTKKLQRSNSAGPGFGSAQAQHKNPFQMGPTDVPGPGSYASTPSLASNSYDSRPMSAFKSSTKRMSVEDTQQGDPGAYTPSSSLYTKQSFHRGGRGGNGSFGSSTKRETKIDVVTDTPGPGAYSQQPQEKPQQPSSSFRSSSMQRPQGAAASKTPGVGSYQPNRSSIEPASRGGGAAVMRGSSSRFMREEHTTDDALGPGAYHSNSSLTDELDKKLKRSSRANPGFGSGQQQHKLPYQKGPAEVPGPGSYDSKAPLGDTGGAQQKSSAFKSSTKRMAVEESGQGDPGAYDTGSYYQLGNTRNASRSGKEGKGSFGATASREVKLDSANAEMPGPGAYGVDATPVEKPMPSSAFRSSSAQRAKSAAERAAVPGVGEYHANPAVVSPSPRNAGSVMRSSAVRFKSEASTTEDSIGPGAYSNEMSSKGHRATLSARSSQNAAKGGSAVFSSDSVRELPF